MSSVLYAHTREGHPREDWHVLLDHLEATARLAARFAAEACAPISPSRLKRADFGDPSENRDRPRPGEILYGPRGLE